MEKRTPQADDNLREREAEATEKETLKDLEDSFGDSTTEELENDELPSPDGSFDEDDELNRADPM
jgi:hypothetical protein